MYHARNISVSKSTIHVDSHILVHHSFIHISFSKVVCNHINMYNFDRTVFVCVYIERLAMAIKVAKKLGAKQEYGRILVRN